MWKTCLTVATAFAIIESAYRFPTGVTTVEQFLLNLVYSPVLIHGYSKLITKNHLRVFLFPFNVWIAELAMGYFMQHIMGYRIWYYEDALALFDGHITLSFYIWWLILGFITTLYFWIEEEIVSLSLPFLISK